MMCCYSNRRRRTTTNCVGLLVLLFLHFISSTEAFTPCPPRGAFSSVKGVKSLESKGHVESSTVSSRLYATSSQELRKREDEAKRLRAARRKKTKKKIKTKTKTKSVNGKTKAEAKTPKLKKKNDLTLRLQQATARAKKAAIEADYVNKKQQEQERARQAGQPDRVFSSRRNETESQIGTLSQLTKIIDQELLSSSDGSVTFNVRAGTTNPPPGITRDSMRSLLQENEHQKARANRPRHSHYRGQRVVEFPTHAIRHVAVVISKPLVRDQVTLEYSCRLRSLAHAIQMSSQSKQSESESNHTETMSSPGSGDTPDKEIKIDADNSDEDELSKPYKPSIICFVGETSIGNLVSDADAGYIYFQHLCAANDISLDGMDILLEKTTLGKGALKRVMRHLKREYVPEWLQESRETESATDEHGVRVSHPRNKCHLHFTFFSCDYDLCRLNDIHNRSPQQSVLRPLLEHDEDDTSLVPNSNNRPRSEDAGIVEASWSYRYCAYPYIHFKDSVTAFLGKCYLLAEELTPVLMNIRGVVDGTEFFQRDNYRVLVSIRRSFVTDMERFYQNQPSLKSTLRQYVSRNEYPLDIVLEGALLSLGRFQDLVRPAGLLVGSVPAQDWKTAEMVLEHAISQLRDACDPDHPLDPSDWGKLEQHYDGPHDHSAEDKSHDDLTSLTSWRLEDDEE